MRNSVSQLLKSGRLLVTAKHMPARLICLRSHDWSRIAMPSAAMSRIPAFYTLHCLSPHFFCLSSLALCPQRRKPHLKDPVVPTLG